MSKSNEQGHATTSFLSAAFKSTNNFSLLDSLIWKMWKSAHLLPQESSVNNEGELSRWEDEPNPVWTEGLWFLFDALENSAALISFFSGI